MRKRYPKIENLNQKLKMLRVYHNYTQSEIAKILDVNRSTYAYYETGRAAWRFKNALCYLPCIYRFFIRYFR